MAWLKPRKAPREEKTSLTTRLIGFARSLQKARVQLGKYYEQAQKEAEVWSKQLDRVDFWGYPQTEEKEDGS